MYQDSAENQKKEREDKNDIIKIVSNFQINLVLRNKNQQKKNNGKWSDSCIKNILK